APAATGGAMKIGGTYLGNNSYEFSVWAPLAEAISLSIVSPAEKLVPLERGARGYWKAGVSGIAPPLSYYYRINAALDRPDPASHYQPEGVHRHSQVVDHGRFPWEDSCWKGTDITGAVIYELHVGTFTPQGDFTAIIPKLPCLKDLGVTVLEIMPIAQFPGERNWGYDGAYPFAVQNSYGGPEGFKTLVNACHKAGLSVMLDVVYNHFGPEGSYFLDYGPYYTRKYTTPWGDAINFDDACSDEVRNYFLENALFWLREYHVDGLRLDAVHGIFDFSASPFLRELGERLDEHSRRERKKIFLVAESDLNDSKIVRSRELGGYGLDAQWLDDFHHSLHALLTGERAGYYRDFGKLFHLEKSLREGFAYSGQYSAYRRRKHGNPSKDLPPERFVAFSQNHDQTGNRMRGERLSRLVSFESLKLAAGAVLLSPYIPLLFMGEEYGEEAPFLYFVNHADTALIEAVRKGRKEEFKAFTGAGEPPDPESPETWRASVLNWEKADSAGGAALLKFYTKLIELRKRIPALSCAAREGLRTSFSEKDQLLLMERRRGESRIFALFNFSRSETRNTLAVPEGRWKELLCSSDRTWNGEGGPPSAGIDHALTLKGRSFILFGGE
ncbi:MAG: malto-oligosyltrehalose trehalohydrolase, partial [Endomicrobiales bacterium]